MALLDYIVEYMSDGQPHRLVEIVDAVHQMGWTSSPSSRYIASYHELTQHPRMFQRVGRGVYKMTDPKRRASPLDMEEVREIIFDLLQKRGALTSTQIWKYLVGVGIDITYKETFHALKGGFFEKKNKREYVLTKHVKYNSL